MVVSKINSRLMGGGSVVTGADKNTYKGKRTYAKQTIYSRQNGNNNHCDARDKR